MAFARQFTFAFSALALALALALRVSDLGRDASSLVNNLAVKP